jgi:hypothetical protein
MIVDCFTFYNEFDVLELRLRILENVVERFVLCEAPFTFRGAPKPLWFATQSERFARWRDRIVTLTFPGVPNQNPWVNEWGQRAFLTTALAECAPDDLVLIGDCDEIPDPRNVARRPAAGAILLHKMLLARGSFNRLEFPGYVWPGTRAVAVRDVPTYGALSVIRKVPVEALEAVEGGWHFTSLGDAGVAQSKMGAYSHVEYDIAYFRDRERLDVTLACTADRWIPFDERFPAVLHEPRWQRFVAAPSDLDAPRVAALEHAHGCLAYVPPTAPRVAILTRHGDALTEVAAHRLGDRFAGAFDDVATLAAQVDVPAWIVVDRLERWDTTTLATLAERGFPLTVFASNARSFDVFQRIVGGHGGFEPGRAFGRTELLAEIAGAGYRIDQLDRVMSHTIPIPHALPAGYAMSMGSFSFPAMEREALYDFLSVGYVLQLAPRDG